MAALSCFFMACDATFLQAAMAAAQAVPKEGTQLKEMLQSTASHSTLAHVLTHLWHTERLWRHALHQGLQLFQETHQVAAKPRVLVCAAACHVSCLQDGLRCVITKCCTRMCVLEYIPAEIFACGRVLSFPAPSSCRIE